VISLFKKRDSNGTYTSIFAPFHQYSLTMGLNGRMHGIIIQNNGFHQRRKQISSQLEKLMTEMDRW
jgi:hypothetical protein